MYSRPMARRFSVQNGMKISSKFTGKFAKFIHSLVPEFNVNLTIIYSIDATVRCLRADIGRSRVSKQHSASCLKRTARQDPV